MSARVGSSKFLIGAFRVLVEQMRSSGIAKPVALRKIVSLVDAVYSSPQSRDLGASKISRLAELCARWHFEPGFIDRDGNPKPLSWNGRSGTLLKLAKHVVGEQAARDAVADLVERRLVKRANKSGWLPKSRVIAPAGFRSAQVLRSSAMLRRLLRTVTHNSSKSYKGDLLLELMAQVPRLPKKDLPKFRSFAKAQGLMFIRAMDDWLETRNICGDASNRLKSNEAGVVAFAFVDD